MSLFLIAILLVMGHFCLVAWFVYKVEKEIIFMKKEILRINESITRKDV